MTDDVREAAIEALLCCADAWMNFRPGAKRPPVVSDIVDTEPGNEAAMALREVYRLTGFRLKASACYVEAAGLLLDGWSP